MITVEAGGQSERREFFRPERPGYYHMIRRTLVRAYADELDHLYSNDAIDEGVARAHDAAEEHRTTEAQRWLSAIFLLRRRAKSSSGDS